MQTEIHTVAENLHSKNMFRCFPFPRRGDTYQTLYRREYVSLIKPEVFPFPSWNSHRILLNQLVFLFTDRSFPGYINLFTCTVHVYIVNYEKIVRRKACYI
jgi:hypothetical protein